MKSILETLDEAMGVKTAEMLGRDDHYQDKLELERAIDLEDLQKDEYYNR